MQLNKYIEHTLLKQDATKAEVIKLLDEAKEYDFLGVCVNPVNVKLASEYLKESGVKTVTVVGFPLGQSTTESKVLETIDAVKNGADEIDMVLNSGKLKDGEFDYIIDELCVKGGADFVKTSTGFVKNGVGAKVEDVKLMYETVKDAGLGVKASGGVRDKDTALAMINAGATRIGTSSGVKICS